MRTRLAALTTATVLGLALTGCSGNDDSVTTKPEPKATSSKTGSDKSEAPQEPAQEEPARIGDTITLAGMDDGSELKVTILKYVDPAKPADPEIFGPEGGKKWAAARFQLVNTGKSTYPDSPSNGAKIADTGGQRFDSTIGDITTGPAMTSDLSLPVGEKAVGWMVWEVPASSKAATIQWAMDSGFADEVGQWNVK
ncbi:DUF4352 domain-containing protein [Streptomyces sp. NBC_00620]|uniref:DUF4352 domain-containing protein n=1 Tax=Streptomyces sp. NBC_00620 TaxID=2903666 RepID=UPI00225BE559|nr:DUF4352 domain-containing protein [Streptomyces sp. NBC_00620]MCX4972573.1 DUF4352 domain-containing protein [Streptomyces sp. NBC_00620]